ncbi:MAG TPA: hypothetical protein VNA88_09720 [Candidatus Kapabacteria bacterium]|jgi:uncharacterized protein (DUF2267 family)|nr:hypothetical protein [Candidatus Kapabacteria bacterium]
MDELIKLVTQNVKISEEQARSAVNTVLGFVRDKLPAPIAEQLDGFLQGGGVNQLPNVSDVAEGAGDMLKGLGGMIPGMGDSNKP